MKQKYIKFILPLILSSVVSALFGCSNKTLSNEDMIINKFNSLKNGNYTFTYTLNDIVMFILKTIIISDI